MSQVEVDKIIPQSGTTLTVGESGDTITVPSGATLDTSNSTVTLPDGSVANAKLVNSSITLNGNSVSLGGSASIASGMFRNIIINGDMSIAQRGTSATGLGNGDSGYHTVDRWRFTETGNVTFEFTQSQSTDVPTGQGFATSLKMDCTTAQASPAANDFLQFHQRFEGQNLQYLKKGTSNALSLTASFWVKSNKTGTYICELYDSDNTRQISKSYTINSADTWEKKTLTFAGDTTGAFDNDNNQSLILNFFLSAGTDFTSGTLQTSWGSLTQANRAVGQVNLADNTANEWYITGVQLEAGTTASDFEFLPHDVNLQRCQRYCNAVMNYGSGNAVGNQLHAARYGASASFVKKGISIMRATPTLSYGITGGAVDNDYSAPDLISLYDANDIDWWIYDVLAEAEL